MVALFPRFQFKVDGRIIVDYEGFVSKVEGTTLSFKLEESDVVPCAVDPELVALGGVKLNVVSLIDSETSSEFVVQGWESLEKLVPLKELMVPFLYSTVIDYVRFGITTGVEPHWTKLLRLCFWYKKCLEINDSNFHFKQTELKRKILKPLRNAEKALAQGQGFLSATEQLATTIISYTSELKFPSLANELGHKVSFSKNNDFVIDSLPCEVKSIYSRATVEHQDNKITELNIHGQKFGENVRPFDELFNFVKSKKVWSHICKAYSQSGKIIFLDATHTFASILLYLLSTNKEADLPFDKALETAVKLAEEGKHLPVIANASISSDEQHLLAFVIPIPLEVFSGRFSMPTATL